jgi:hypothetical protein
LDYAWIDTCCINKSSSSELSEAINSMFKWYKRSAICYAFLEDFKHSNLVEAGSGIGTNQLGFGHCRWFTRGWTLQELIAPKTVEFYDHSWTKVAEKEKHAGELQAITGIDKFVLEGGPLHEVSIGRRMSWAAGRATKREEDIAYSLLGIFDVHMPLVYGEGPKAFLRLQEQILKRSADHTLFAWRAVPSSKADEPVTALLASSPNLFRNFSEKYCDNGPRDNLIRVWDSQSPRNPITLNNKGIQITSRVQDLRRSWAPNEQLVLVLNCSFNGDSERAAGIYLQRQAEDRYARIRADEIVDLRPEGRHISIQTLHGLSTMSKADRFQHDQPWTTSYQLRRESQEELYYNQTAQPVKDLYSHAFYMKSVNARTVFGKYSVHGVLMAEKGRVIKSFRFYPDTTGRDLILQTRPGLKGAIMLKSSESTDLLLILLDINESIPIQNDGPPPNSLSLRNYWFDAICLTQRRLDENPRLLSDLILNTYSTKVIGTGKSILVSGTRLRMGIQLKNVTVEGLPMASILIRGPWPTSILRSFVYALLKPLNILLWLATVTLVFIIGGPEYLEIPRFFGFVFISDDRT